MERERGESQERDGQKRSPWVRGFWLVFILAILFALALAFLFRH